MPRNMSFFLTTEQIRNRTKTVTRRTGWGNLKPGEIVNACVKCQGLKPGEKVERICQIRIVSNTPEELWRITKPGCVAEGFPDMSPDAFVAMFRKHMGGGVNQIVNVIEFEYVESAKTGGEA